MSNPLQCYLLVPLKLYKKYIKLTGNEEVVGDSVKLTFKDHSARITHYEQWSHYAKAS